jgi:uncharacterized protein
MNKDLVGKVLTTMIFPFKSMRGIELPEISLRSVSVVGDRTRKLDLVDTTQTPSFVDTIKFPKLLQYQAYLIDPSNPKTSEVRVKTPEGKDYSADEQELVDELSGKFGKKLTVVRMGRGAYHSMPVSLISTASIAELSKVYGEELDPLRFRMNLVVETNSGVPFEEDNWVGKMISFGESSDSAKIIAVKLDDRCATINMDPGTGESDVNILKTLVQLRGKNLGIYCTITLEGKIRKGDAIYLYNLA